MPTRVEGTVDFEVYLSTGRVQADGDLTLSIGAFDYEIEGKFGSFAGAINQAVTVSDMNFVYLDKDGDLVVTVDGWPNATHIRLAKVKADNSIITRISDARVFLLAELDREFSLSAEEADQDTDLAAWQEAVSHITGTLPPGHYMIEWYAELKHSNVNMGEYAEARVHYNDAGQIGYEANPLDLWSTFSGHKRKILSTEGTIQVDIDYRRQGGGTAYIRRVRIWVRRVK